MPSGLEFRQTILTQTPEPRRLCAANSTKNESCSYSGESILLLPAAILPSFQYLLERTSGGCGCCRCVRAQRSRARVLTPQCFGITRCHRPRAPAYGACVVGARGQSIEELHQPHQRQQSQQRHEELHHPAAAAAETGDIQRATQPAPSLDHVGTQRLP